MYRVVQLVSSLVEEVENAFDWRDIFRGADIICEIKGYKATKPLCVTAELSPGLTLGEVSTEQDYPVRAPFTLLILLNGISLLEMSNRREVDLGRVHQDA